MFQKPFAVKSDTNIRNSEKKKLLTRFPHIDGITNKTTAALIQMTCHKGENVIVYTFDKEPLFFGIEKEGILYPTVYLTWKLPAAFPVIVIGENVYQKLLRGADLFLQGITRPLRETLEFGIHAPVAISVETSGNKLRGPLAVGYSLKSSMEMIASGMQGPGVRLLHFFGDLLWNIGTHTQPLEVSVNWQTVDTSLKNYEINFPALSALNVNDKTEETVNEMSCQHSPECTKHEHEEVTVASEETLQEEEPPSTVTMEDLLKQCFIMALKYRVTKKGQLPLDVGEFYSHYLLQCVPSNQRIDMKKTIYKKFSVFLKEINKDENGPVLKIIAKNKGSEMIAEVNWEHPMLKNFKAVNEDVEKINKKDEKKIKVEEYFAVTGPVLALFRDRCEKGDLLTMSQVREIITTFVKSRSAVMNNKVVPSDVTLIQILQSNEPVDWNKLIQKITTKMTKTYVITWVDGHQIVRKIELPKIVFKIENRSGNKKVTLVNNLSIYGIDCKKFCHEVQTGAAASAIIVNNAALCEGPQILVQGNQISFISKTLISKYGIDKKYMIGLELIPKNQQ